MDADGPASVSLERETDRCPEGTSHQRSHVGANDRGDDRVASRCRVVWPEHDRLARSAGPGSLRGPSAPRRRRRRPFEAARHLEGARRRDRSARRPRRAPKGAGRAPRAANRSTSGPGRTRIAACRSSGPIAGLPPVAGPVGGGPPGRAPEARSTSPRRSGLPSCPPKPRDEQRPPATEHQRHVDPSADRGVTDARAGGRDRPGLAGPQPAPSRRHRPRRATARRRRA